MRRVRLFPARSMIFRKLLQALTFFATFLGQAKKVEPGGTAEKTNLAAALAYGISLLLRSNFMMSLRNSCRRLDATVLKIPQLKRCGYTVAAPEKVPEGRMRWELEGPPGPHPFDLQPFTFSIQYTNNN